MDLEKVFKTGDYYNDLMKKCVEYENDPFGYERINNMEEIVSYNFNNKTKTKEEIEEFKNNLDLLDNDEKYYDMSNKIDTLVAYGILNANIDMNTLKSKYQRLYLVSHMFAGNPYYDMQDIAPAFASKGFWDYLEKEYSKENIPKVVSSLFKEVMNEGTEFYSDISRLDVTKEIIRNYFNNEESVFALQKNIKTLRKENGKQLEMNLSKKNNYI